MIQAGRDGSFDKRLAHAVLAEDDQWDGPSMRVLRRASSLQNGREDYQRRLAHGCSKRCSS